MRPYETLVVLRTDLGEEAAKLLSRFESVIVKEGGSIDENRDWGVRDLAYVIGKQKQGHFHLIEYQAEPQVVKELERTMRIVEGVLRFVSVQQEHTGLPEPRVREHYDRRDAPLSEMRTPGREGDAPAPAAAAAPDEVAATAAPAAAPAAAVSEEEAPSAVAAGQETPGEAVAAAEAVEE